MGAMASVAVPRGCRAVLGSCPDRVPLAPSARCPRPLPLLPAPSGRYPAAKGKKLSGLGVSEGITPQGPLLFGMKWNSKNIFIFIVG